jgi:hypothetical protein
MPRARRGGARMGRRGRLERHGHVRRDGLADERLRRREPLGGHRQLHGRERHESRSAHPVRGHDASGRPAVVGRRPRVRLSADVLQLDARPGDRLPGGRARLHAHRREQAQRRPPGEIQPHVGQVEAHEIVARRHQGTRGDAAAMVERDPFHLVVMSLHELHARLLAANAATLHDVVQGDLLVVVPVGLEAQPRPEDVVGEEVVRGVAAHDDRTIGEAVLLDHVLARMFHVEIGRAGALGAVAGQPVALGTEDVEVLAAVAGGLVADQRVAVRAVADVDALVGAVAHDAVLHRVVLRAAEMDAVANARLEVAVVEGLAADDLAVARIAEQDPVVEAGHLAAAHHAALGAVERDAVGRLVLPDGGVGRGRAGDDVAVAVEDGGLA